MVGGDGFMLETLKKNQKTINNFYGINSGNYGFLMNKFSKKNTLRISWRCKKNYYLTIRNEST